MVAGAGGVFWASEPTRAPADRNLSAQFMDGPPVRSSGGFGEPSCIDCHWGAEMNDPGGAFFIEGVPEAYRPGEVYELTVVLTRPGMAVGGFQMAARFLADSTQAGTVEIPPAEEGRVGIVTERDVMYAQQRLAGMELTAPDTARWMIRWTAPQRLDEVRFHASGNVGDGDDSQIGDYVYVTEKGTVGRTD
jgi:hypothetical protein